jgi:CMP-N-acetylneuraminic acid synthetase
VSSNGTPRTLAVIPARGGSKGVPRKNVRPVLGRPLLAYTADTALASRHLLHDVVLSTDDEEIAEVGRSLGLSVPFLRPSELAGDAVPMVPVLQHAVSFLERRDGVRMDWVLLLQPTEPFRTVEDVEAALDLADRGGCDSVISVVRVFAVHPVLMKRIEGDRLLPYCVEEREGTRRQDYDPPAYMRNGAIYLTRRDVLMERASIWGDVIRPYVMPPERSLSVDEERDLKVIEAIMLDRQGSQA